MQQEFIDRLLPKIEQDAGIAGLAVGGSWISKEIDRFSDLDLVLVTHSRVSGDPQLMKKYAGGFGSLLSAFTGEHVGEPRLLICLYDDPLLHVDIKFVTIDEFAVRVEDPAIVYDPSGLLAGAMRNSRPQFPMPDHQWIEDRFWTWVHYACLKLGRGEWMEALDFMAYLRMTVLGPLLLQKNGRLPRGVRKVEMLLPQPDLDALKATIPAYTPQSIMSALEQAVTLYGQLQSVLFRDVTLQSGAKERVLAYLEEIKDQTR